MDNKSMPIFYIAILFGFFQTCIGKLFIRIEREQLIILGSWIVPFEKLKEVKGETVENIR
jgi:hypothetical protein